MSKNLDITHDIRKTYSSVSQTDGFSNTCEILGEGKEVAYEVSDLVDEVCYLIFITKEDNALVIHEYFIKESQRWLYDE